MAIAYVGAGIPGDAWTDPGVPAGTVGDLLVMLAYGDTAASWFSGWSAAHSSTPSGICTVFWRIATGSDSTSSVYGQFGRSQVFRFSGVDTTTPIASIASEVQSTYSTTAGSLTVLAPAGSVVVATLFALQAQDADGRAYATIGAAPSFTTNTAISVSDYSATNGYTFAQGVWYATSASAASITSTRATVTSGGDSASPGLFEWTLFALNPASGGGGGSSYSESGAVTASWSASGSNAASLAEPSSIVASWASSADDARQGVDSASVVAAWGLSASDSLQLAEAPTVLASVASVSLDSGRFAETGSILASWIASASDLVLIYSPMMGWAVGVILPPPPAAGARSSNPSPPHNEGHVARAAPGPAAGQAQRHAPLVPGVHAAPSTSPAPGGYAAPVP